MGLLGRTSSLGFLGGSFGLLRLLGLGSGDLLLAQTESSGGTSDLGVLEGAGLDDGLDVGVDLGHLVVGHPVLEEGLAGGTTALLQGGDGGCQSFVPVVVRGLGRLLWLARLLGRGLEPRQTSLSLCQT